MSYDYYTEQEESYEWINKYVSLNCSIRYMVVST
jgi:hypothetical protein